MAKINLRDHYPHCTKDEIIDVSDEVAEAMFEDKRWQEAYRIRTLRYKAYYSLDRNDSRIQSGILLKEPSMYDLYERKETARELFDALCSLPEAQCRRIYAHYYLSVSTVQIAQVEGVSLAAVHKSLLQGLKKIKLYLNFPTK